MTYRRIIPAALTAGATLIILPGVTYAHANAVSCVDMATSTWRVTNDHPTSETFTTTEGPSGSVAGGAGSYTDVVWNGDTLHVTGTWSDGFVGSTTGTGDCTPDEQPTTTTEAPTSTSTTTPTSTIPTTSSTTTPPTSTLVTTTTSTATSVPPSSTTSPTTTTPPTTVTTTPSTSTTSVPSTPAPAPSSPQLPATGVNTGLLLTGAGVIGLLGAIAVCAGGRHRDDVLR